MSNNLNLESTVKRSSEPLQAGLDDEVVMMSVQKGSYYGLDPVGAKIWGHLEAPILVSDVVEHLLEEYKVERERCEKETLEFLESMLQEELIEVVQ